MKLHFVDAMSERVEWPKAGLVFIGAKAEREQLSAGHRTELRHLLRREPPALARHAFLQRQVGRVHVIRRER
jgi:hypothetical protein